MKKFKYALLCFVIMGALPLCGCSMTTQLENQAYAIGLAVDRMPSGEIRLSVQLPTLGGNTQKDAQSSSGGSRYTISSATASSFFEAMDLLSATVPRAINLSQLKVIIVGQTLAQESGFKDLICDMIRMPHLHNAAYLTICLGDAQTLLAGQNPIIGARLSSNVVAALEHYAQYGYLTPSRLSDLYYSMHSVYGDPVVMLSATASGETQRPIPSGMMGSALPGALPREGENKNEYMGCALIDANRMVGVLTGSQARWVNIFRGDQRETHVLCQGQSLKLTFPSRPSVTVDLSGKSPRISVAMRVAYTSANLAPDPDILRAQLTAEINEVFFICQSLGVEPFSFAETCARSFSNIDDFIAYDWSSSFAKAQIDLDIRLSDTTRSQ